MALAPAVSAPTLPPAGLAEGTGPTEATRVGVVLASGVGSGRWAQLKASAASRAPEETWARFMAQGLRGRGGVGYFWVRQRGQGQRPACPSPRPCGHEEA